MQIGPLVFAKDITQIQSTKENADDRKAALDALLRKIDEEDEEQAQKEAVRSKKLADIHAAAEDKYNDFEIAKRNVIRNKIYAKRDLRVSERVKKMRVVFRYVILTTLYKTVNEYVPNKATASQS